MHCTVILKNETFQKQFLEILSKEKKYLFFNRKTVVPVCILSILDTLYIILHITLIILYINLDILLIKFTCDTKHVFKKSILDNFFIIKYYHELINSTNLVSINFVSIFM